MTDNVLEDVQRFDDAILGVVLDQDLIFEIFLKIFFNFLIVTLIIFRNGHKEQNGINRFLNK